MTVTAGEKNAAGQLRDAAGRRVMVVKAENAALATTDVQTSLGVVDADGREHVVIQGVVGQQGPAGSSSPTTDAWAWADANGMGPAALVVDWGPIFNAMRAAGILSIGLGEHAFPFSTPIAANGQAAHGLFQGAQGRGWYSGAGIESNIGSRLIWKGGASPRVTGNDASMTNGSAVLTVASGPFAVPANQGNIAFNGREVIVTGAGPGGTDLKTRIINRSSNTQVTLADTASATVSGVHYDMIDWARAIQCQGSSGISFRDCKILYDNPAFDGILIDMRSDSIAWSARGELDNCLLSGAAADYTNATTTANSAVRAFALVFLNGMGEAFTAKDCQFGNALAGVRGMYDNNTDDAHFLNCHFHGLIEGGVINPGRFWTFDKCSSQGSNFGGPYLGPIFGSDGPASIESIIRLNDFSFWDFGRDWNNTGGSITNGSTTLTVTNLSKIGTYVEDIFWKDRIVVMQGAGPGGADLKTRIVKRLSATTLQLKDAASTTVSNGYWFIGDGGVMYQKPGYAWDITITSMMTWLAPSAEFDLQGSGKIYLRNWWANRDHRPELPGFAEFMRFNANPAGGNKMIIDVELPRAFGSSNALKGVRSAIVNSDGHDIYNLTSDYAFNYRRRPGRRHTNWESLHPNQGATPSVVAHSGVALNGGVDVWGNDERGVITFTATGAGIPAGLLLDVTFADVWPSLYTGGTPNQTVQPFWAQFQPAEHSSNNGEGAAAAAADLYYKFDNTVNTGLSIGSRNAIPAGATLCFAYEFERL